MIHNLKQYALTIALITATLTCFYLNGAAELLIYQRTLILDQYELWRLITAPLVHYSNQHLFFNAIMILLLGCLIERNHRSSLIMLYLCSTLLTSSYLLLFNLDIQFFAGLSGYASALLGWYLCHLYVSTKSHPQQRLIIMTILIIYVKIFLEANGWATGMLLFSDIGDASFVVVWQSHAIGITSAILLFYYGK